MFLLPLRKHIGCYGNFKFDLQWEKWNLRFIAISLQIFWQKFYRNICWVVLYQVYHLVQTSQFDWVQVKFAKTY